MKLLIVAFALLFSVAATAQPFESPFSVNLKKELLLSGTGLLLSVGGYLSVQNLPTLGPTELGNLSAENVLAIDRFATTQYSLSARSLSDVGLASSFALSAVFLSSHTPRSEYSKLLVMGTEAALLTTGITLLTKGMTGRIRPYAYNTSVPLEERMDIDAKQSFFSGHTSIASSACFFAAQVAQQYDFARWQKQLIWAGAATIPAFVGTMRVLGGKHFLTDVVTGYALGAAIGITIPYLHLKRGSSFSLQSGLSGFRLQYQF